VDTVEVAVNPVLLGDGVPLLPPGALTKLVLADTKILAASGIVVLTYAVPGSERAAPRIRFIKQSSRATRQGPAGSSERGSGKKNAAKSRARSKAAPRLGRRAAGPRRK
jgi:hypothetical protein